MLELEIKRFIEAIYGSASGEVSLWWRDKPGAKSPIDKQKWFSYPDQAAEMATFAESKADRDVYLSVSTYSERRRVPEFCKSISAIYQDTDTFDPAGYRVEPSIIVQTSEGRTHCWFVLDEPADAERAEVVTKKMTYAHKAEGADVSSWGRNKILRVPGSVNTGHDGFPEEVTAAYTGNVYSLADIANAYDDVSITATIPAPVALSEAKQMAIVQPSDLPNFLDAQSMLPENFDIRLITQEPEIGSEGNRSQMREKLILECMRAGLDDLNTAAVAWNSKCGEKYHENGEREDLLWYEVAKFRAIVDSESGALATTAPADERPALTSGTPTRIDLLTKAERKIAQDHWDKTFPGEYERYVKEAVKIYNAPYHRAMTWMILSAVVGETAKIREGKRGLRLNFYIAPLGPTTTGKSEAMDMATTVIHGSFEKGDNPDIGSDSSPGALTEKLHKRNGKSTIFKADEADGLIEQWVGKNGYHTGMLQFMTKLFDGWVEPQNRRGDVDQEYAECVFTMCLMGTESGLSAVLTRKMFESGFLARMSWFIGEQVEVPRDLLGFKMGSVSGALSDKSQIKKWSNKWGAVRETWMYHSLQPGGEFIQFENDKVAKYFLEKTAEFEHGLFKNHRNYDIIQPSIRRIVRSMVKMAALVAIEDGRMTISMEDILLALLQGEELFGNLEYMSTVISDSALAKATNDLEMWIAGRPQQVAKIEEIYRSHAGASKQEVDSLLTQLTSQGRVGVIRNTDKSISYEIRSA